MATWGKALWSANALPALIILSAFITSGAVDTQADADQGLLSWLARNDAQHNVVIEYPKGGERGIYAGTDIKDGGLIAKIPMKCAVIFTAAFKPDEQNLVILTVPLLQDAARPDSPYQSYYKALPMLHSNTHTITYATFPEEYLPLIKSEPMVEIMTKSRQNMAAFWEEHSSELTNAGITPEKIQAALSTLMTRLFVVKYRGNKRVVMKPLIDFANHRTNCTTSFEYGRCDYFENPELQRDNTGGRHFGDIDAVDIQDMCIYWRAGTAIRKGEELCISYQSITPDQAFLEYAFILPDEPPSLSRVDMADFSWLKEPAPEFDGPINALKKELRRVEQRIKVLERASQEEAAMKVSPSDPGGVVLSGLKALRQQRLAALRREAERLRESMADKGALSFDKDGDDDGDEEEAESGEAPAPITSSLQFNDEDEGGEGKDEL